MNLTAWLVAEHDDTVTRWREQVLAVVPEEERTVRLPNGNSMRWTAYHVARHAALALAVAQGRAGERDPRSSAFPAAAVAGGAGLQEVEQAWAADLDLAAVEDYGAAVLRDLRAYLAALEATSSTAGRTSPVVSPPPASGTRSSAGCGGSGTAPSPSSSGGPCSAT